MSINENNSAAETSAAFYKRKINRTKAAATAEKSGIRKGFGRKSDRNTGSANGNGDGGDGTDDRRIFSLLPQRPEGAEKKKIIRTVVALVITSILLGILSLYYSTYKFGDEMFASYFAVPRIVLYNILPIMLFMGLCYFVFRRLWAAHAFTAFWLMLTTWTHMYKMEFRDDPLVASDFGLIKEAANMQGNYDWTVSSGQVAAIIAMIAVTVLLKFVANARFKSLAVQAGGLLVCAVLLGSFVCGIAMNDGVYNSIKNEGLINKWSEQEVYISKGFVYPFLHSISDAVDSKPDSYSDDKALAVLADYQDQDIPANKKVNVMCVMLEAFQDFSKYDEIEWNRDPYEIYHNIQAESYHGKLVTNIFAGGTENTERCFITGYADYGAIANPMMSYAWYFRDQGYDVQGSHGCYGWFYDRENINRNLGFEDYYFIENRYKELAGGLAWDSVFIPDLYNLYKLKNDESDKPYFSFSVSYQNHGPYDTETNSSGVSYVSKKYSQQTQNIANNYFSGINSTSRYLRDYLEKLRNDDEPVVVVLFGDHNPWLGDSNSVYNEWGLNINVDSQEGFENYYETDYLIWANEAAKQQLGNDFTGQGPTVGPYFLMNLLFKQCGWHGSAFTQFTADVMNRIQTIHADGRFMANGTLMMDADLDDDQQQALSNYRTVQYYMKHSVNPVEIGPVTKKFTELDKSNKYLNNTGGKVENVAPYSAVDDVSDVAKKQEEKDQNPGGFLNALTGQTDNNSGHNADDNGAAGAFGPAQPGEGTGAEPGGAGADSGDAPQAPSVTGGDGGADNGSGAGGSGAGAGGTGSGQPAEPDRQPGGSAGSGDSSDSGSDAGAGSGTGAGSGSGSGSGTGSGSGSTNDDAPGGIVVDHL